MMNLRQQISKFRSEILIGKYDSAIALGRQILTHLDTLSTLGLLQHDKLQHCIQQQYEKCLALSSLIVGRVAEHQPIKKWESKPRGSKWNKRLSTSSHRAENSPTSPLAELELSPIKAVVQSELLEFLQQVEKEVIMPIRMPAFFRQKALQNRVVAVPEQFFADCLAYFADHDFATVPHEVFLAQRSAPDNSFTANGLTEVLVDCKNLGEAEISAAQSHTLPLHTIFLTADSLFQVR